MRERNVKGVVTTLETVIYHHSIHVKVKKQNLELTPSSLIAGTDRYNTYKVRDSSEQSLSLATCAVSSKKKNLEKVEDDIHRYMDTCIHTLARSLPHIHTRVRSRNRSTCKCSPGRVKAYFLRTRLVN